MMLKKYGIKDELLEDIKEFKSEDRRLKYPLWIDDYLIVVPHKRRGTIEMLIKDGYGHEYDGCRLECNSTDNVLELANELVCKCYNKAYDELDYCIANGAAYVEY